MLKQIILCDYKHIDFNPPRTDSDLLSFAVVTEKRKKVRRLLPDIEKTMEEINEIMDQLSDLLTQLPKRFIGTKERSDDIKLGLKIADKIQCDMEPEDGLTYEQLALDLFPEVRTKGHEQLEWYIQRIARAIDAVQVFLEREPLGFSPSHYHQKKKVM